VRNDGSSRRNRDSVRRVTRHCGWRGAVPSLTRAEDNTGVEALGASCALAVEPTDPGCRRRRAGSRADKVRRTGRLDPFPPTSTPRSWPTATPCCLSWAHLVGPSALARIQLSRTGEGCGGAFADLRAQGDSEHPGDATVQSYFADSANGPTQAWLRYAAVSPLVALPASTEGWTSQV
jgi:hypothetical protein